MINPQILKHDISAIRKNSPLIHNITNYVVTNFSANALLAIGASPVMAHAAEEMEEMVSIASALVINIGTLDSEWIQSMLIAGQRAHRMGKPIVLDPVGAGATTYRTETAWNIIRKCHPTIIRGNASEIMALVDSNIKSKGVDSSASSVDAINAAQSLSQSTGAIVVISGETDYITNGIDTYTVEGGAPIMARVTGMGCTATALIGAFAAVNPNPMLAALSAMEVMSFAGERAAANAYGNGSMQMLFLDELYNLTPDKF